jgi:hypothetical protein
MTLVVGAAITELEAKTISPRPWQAFNLASLRLERVGNVIGGP